MMSSHLCTSKVLAGEAFRRSFFSKNGLRVGMVIQVTQKEEKQGNCIHVDALNLD